MREILFRGKHIHVLPQNKHLDETWIYGYLCGENYINSPDLEGEFLIDPETVCQYTGLTDKNGRKIFEGDIINDIDYGIMKCIYLHGSFVWYKEDGFKIECMKYVPVVEVIGNIFDNPDLLHKKQEAQRNE